MLEAAALVDGVSEGVAEARVLGGHEGVGGHPAGGGAGCIPSSKNRHIPLSIIGSRLRAR